MNVLVQPLVPLSVTLAESGADALSFERIYASRFNEVARWVRAFGGLDADVPDLTQEVFMVVRRKLTTFDGRNLNGWLYRLTQRTVRDYRRKAWFRRIFISERPDAEARGDELHADADPSKILERREAERLLAAILQGMSERRRIAFVLFEVEGYSGEEIAELEGVPLNTVWTRLHHARKDFMKLVHVARQEGRLP